MHNGTRAVCSFTLSNQGNGADLRAGSELYGIEFVDDAHVPHRADLAYFVDKYGTRQNQLFVVKGDTATYMLEFPEVDPRVRTAEFHVRWYSQTQVIGGVSVGEAGSAPQAGGAAVATADPNAPAAPAAPASSSSTQDKLKKAADKVKGIKDLFK